LQYHDVAEVVYEGQPLSFNPELEGVVTSWSIEPTALPLGLVFDEKLGALTGVPTGRHPKTAYTITASNEAGTTTASLNLAVQCEAPGRIEYTPNLLAYPWETDLEMTPQAFSQGGRPASVEAYAVTPTLPTGLTLNATTGVIAGHPTDITPERTYQITATNESGACEVSNIFEIKELPPHDLKYEGVDDYYCLLEKMELKPTVVGGAKIWVVEPALPKGMALDERTGIIAGTPQERRVSGADTTQYTITASNNAGGTPIVVDFEILAPAPTKLAYPEVGSQLKVGAEVRFDPVVTPSPAGSTFKVEPALPEGLQLSEEDGHLTGEPSAVAPRTAYTVTCANKMGSQQCQLNFEVIEIASDPTMVDEAFAHMLLEVTDLANLPPEPEKENIANWMVWMVHRAWLNDPSLTTFDFSNMQMPMPADEPRIAPRLMSALANNTCITSLLLPNTNFRNPQAHEMAAAFSKNTSLEVANVESNWIEPDGVAAIAEALGEQTEGKLHTFRLANQLRGGNFGRTVEEQLHQMLVKNQNITKLGFEAKDAHWKNQIANALTKNTDAARRKRKAAKGIPDKPEVAPAVPKVLTKVLLTDVPDKAVWEIFDDSDTQYRVLRKFMHEKKLMPTREQVQAYAKKEGETISFGKVAPLLKEFRSMIMTHCLNKSVTCWDDKGHEVKGTMKGFVEKNDRVNLDIFGNPGHWDFGSTKLPTIAASEALSDWLFNEEEASAPAEA